MASAGLLDKRDVIEEVAFMRDVTALQPCCRQSAPVLNSSKPKELIICWKQDLKTSENNNLKPSSSFGSSPIRVCQNQLANFITTLLSNSLSAASVQRLVTNSSCKPAPWSGVLAGELTYTCF